MVKKSDSPADSFFKDAIKEFKVKLKHPIWNLFIMGIFSVVLVLYITQAGIVEPYKEGFEWIVILILNSAFAGAFIIFFMIILFGFIEYLRDNQ